MGDALSSPSSIAAITSQAGLAYPRQPPFSPSERFPEYPFEHLSGEDNPVYRAVRQTFIDAGLDAGRIGEPSWNPLGCYVRPGARVFLLCNFVFHRRQRESAEAFAGKCTHGSVLRALIDYARIAAGPQGRIAFGNAPLQSCNWERVLADTGAGPLEGFYAQRGVAVEALDLRAVMADAGTFGPLRRRERGGPRGIAFDLGRESRLASFGSGAGRHGRPRVRDYDPARTEAFHAGDAHRYLVSEAILEADAVISVPKLKTHEKVGLTAALKGLVGTVAHKDCLAHHRFGPPKKGGDEFPDRVAAVTPLAHLHDWLNRGEDAAAGDRWRGLARAGEKTATAVLRRCGISLGGAWHGNDTAWRMVHDLYRIARYGAADGVLREVPQRTHIALIDGIVGGEGQGPLAPDPVSSGVLVFSDDLRTADCAAWRLMGYRPEALRLLDSPGAEDGTGCLLRINGAESDENAIRPILGRPFRMPQGWRDYAAGWTTSG